VLNAQEVFLEDIGDINLECHKYHRPFPISSNVFLLLRRIFGPKRDEVMEDWRKLHNEELHNLYSLPNIVRMIQSRMMRWAGHVAQMWEKRNPSRILVGKPEGKRPLGTP
jgi:hypothetical protein